MAGAPLGYEVFVGPIQGRVDISKARFDREIDGHGEPAMWEQACPCPCSNNEQTDQPDPFCMDCDGVGWLYHSPQPITVIVDRLGVDQKPLDKVGMFWTGDVNLTIRVENPVAYYHRVTLLHATIEFQERTTRKFGPVQSLRMPIGTRATEFIHRATKDRVKVVERVNRIMHRVNNRAVLLRIGVDYDVTDDGKIDWSKGDRIGTAPRLDSVICANYYIHPVYVVTSLAPYGVRVSKTNTGVAEETPLLLPFTVMAKLDTNLHRPGGVAVLPGAS
jgi:hypothetical protein